MKKTTDDVNVLLSEVCMFEGRSLASEACRSRHCGVLYEPNSLLLGSRSAPFPALVAANDSKGALVGFL